jgi:hypothetical protein
MGPQPVVTGISPKEAAAGMKLTIRGKRLCCINATQNTDKLNITGENLGVSHQDILGVLVHGELL